MYSVDCVISIAADFDRVGPCAPNMEQGWGAGDTPIDGSENLKNDQSPWLRCIHKRKNPVIVADIHRHR